MTNKTKHSDKNIFCWYCWKCISKSKVLELHVKICLVISHTKSVLLSEEGQYENFQIFKRFTKAPFIMYGNFEYVLIPSTDHIDFGPNTKKYQDIFTSGFKLIHLEDQYSKPCKSYFRGDAFDKFLNDMTKEREYCPKVIDTKFTKPLFMTRKRCKGFDNFTKCCICKKLYEKGEVKAKDYGHFNRKYPGSAHQECNLQSRVKFWLWFNPYFSGDWKTWF